MNYPDSSTVNTTTKKIRFSSAARALIVGLASLLPGAAALAERPTPGLPNLLSQGGKAAGEQTSDALPGERGTPGLGSSSGPGIAKAGEAPLPGLASPGTPIQGTSVGLEGDPGSIKVSAKTDSTGAFKFDNLPAGKYKLTLAGLPSQSITVAAGGGIKGIVSRQSDGKVSIAFNGQVGVGPDIPQLGSGSGVIIAILAAGAVPVGDVEGDGGGRGGVAIVKPVDVVPNAVIAGIIIVAKVPDRDTDAASPGKTIGEPLSGTPVGLEGDPGSIKVSARTDSTGAFKFDKLPAGKYKLTLAGLPPQSITVAADGIAGGKVMRGNDGSINIFDRWGNLLVAAGSNTDNIPAGNKVATNPRFEPPKSGFAGMGGGGPGILPGMGRPGPGPMSPSPGVMSPGPMGAGPAGPGGGAMRS